MKYQKLSVFLFGELAKCEPGSTNAIITEYLLEHMNKKEDIDVQTIAKKCHVGVGTVSRYIRNAGFDHFGEFRDLFQNEKLNFEQIHSEDLLSCHTSAMKECIDSIQKKDLQKLVKEIYHSEKINIFGLLKGQSAAILLQTDLLSLGKMTYSTTSPKDQMECILHSTKDELILLFSATCSYFDYFDIRSKKDFLSCRNIWMIGNGNCPSYIHHFISYDSSNIPLSHPLQLMCVAEMIAQEYAKMIQKNI